MGEMAVGKLLMKNIGRYGAGFRRKNTRDLPKVVFRERSLIVRAADILYLWHNGWKEDSPHAQDHFAEIVAARNGDKGAAARLKALSKPRPSADQRINDALPQVSLRRTMKRWKKPPAKVIRESLPKSFLALFADFDKINIIVGDFPLADTRQGINWPEVFDYFRLDRFVEAIGKVADNSIFENSRGKRLSLKKVLCRYRKTEDTLLFRLSVDDGHLYFTLVPKQHYITTTMRGHIWTLQDEIGIKKG